MQNKCVRLASRPTGWVTADNFELVEAAMPTPSEGEVLIQNDWLSLDPYMRSRISDAKSYAKGVNPGDVMVGGAVGTIIESRSDAFSVGDTVLAASGWRLYAKMPAQAVTKIDTTRVQASAYLGVLGMPGITAWTGLLNICQPKAGETVVVDAASGAVGSVVGQLAKQAGCRIVGIAGGKAKCDYVVNELGFDACADHRAPDFHSQLDALLPQGVDCLFENVGGEIFEALLARMNVFSRVALCGMVSEFNREPHAHRTLRSILINRIRIQGFIVSSIFIKSPDVANTLKSIVRLAFDNLR
jgi:NADPH-dependent curcumin reductase CurA